VTAHDRAYGWGRTEAQLDRMRRDIADRVGSPDRIPNAATIPLYFAATDALHVAMRLVRVISALEAEDHAAARCPCDDCELEAEDRVRVNGAMHPAERIILADPDVSEAAAHAAVEDEWYGFPGGSIHGPIAPADGDANEDARRHRRGGTP
jgi:hypothetical protein